MSKSRVSWTRRAQGEPNCKREQVGRNWKRKMWGRVLPTHWFLLMQQKIYFLLKMLFQRKQTTTEMIAGKFGGFRNRQSWWGREGRRARASCTVLEQFVWASQLVRYTSHVPQRPKNVVGREIRLSSGISCFPHSCAWKSWSFQKSVMWTFNRSVHIISALSSLSRVPTPTMLPLLHEAQSPICSSTAKHRGTNISSTFDIFVRYQAHDTAQLYIYAVFSPVSGQ